MWGRLAACGGLATRQLRRYTTGAQLAKLPHNRTRLHGHSTSLAIGRTISHYRVIEKLGAGGMGDIYKARDARGGQTIALCRLSNSRASARHDRPGKAMVCAAVRMLESYFHMAKSIEELQNIAKRVRRDIVKMIAAAKSGHQI